MELGRKDPKPITNWYSAHENKGKCLAELLEHERALKKKLLRKQKFVFSDKSLPPTNIGFRFTSNEHFIPPTKWIRARKLYPNNSVYPPSSGPVVPLLQCFGLSSRVLEICLLAVSSKPELLRQICPVSFAECGFYGCVFFKNGVWIKSIVDDMIPFSDLSLSSDTDSVSDSIMFEKLMRDSHLEETTDAWKGQWEWMKGQWERLSVDASKNFPVVAALKSALKVTSNKSAEKQIQDKLGKLTTYLNDLHKKNLHHAFKTNHYQYSRATPLYCSSKNNQHPLCLPIIVKAYAKVYPSLYSALSKLSDEEFITETIADLTGGVVGTFTISNWVGNENELYSYLQTVTDKSIHICYGHYATVQNDLREENTPHWFVLCDLFISQHDGRKKILLRTSNPILSDNDGFIHCELSSYVERFSNICSEEGFCVIDFEKFVFHTINMVECFLLHTNSPSFIDISSPMGSSHASSPERGASSESLTNEEEDTLANVAFPIGLECNQRILACKSVFNYENSPIFHVQIASVTKVLRLFFSLSQVDKRTSQLHSSEMNVIQRPLPVQLRIYCRKKTIDNAYVYELICVSDWTYSRDVSLAVCVQGVSDLFVQTVFATPQHMVTLLSEEKKIMKEISLMRTEFSSPGFGSMKEVKESANKLYKDGCAALQTFLSDAEKTSILDTLSGCCVTSNAPRSDESTIGDSDDVSSTLLDVERLICRFAYNVDSALVVCAVDNSTANKIKGELKLPYDAFYRNTDMSIPFHTQAWIDDPSDSNNQGSGEIISIISPRGNDCGSLEANSYPRILLV